MGGGAAHLVPEGRGTLIVSNGRSGDIPPLGGAAGLRACVQIRPWLDSQCGSEENHSYELNDTLPRTRGQPKRSVSRESRPHDGVGNGVASFRGGQQNICSGGGRRVIDNFTLNLMNLD